MAKRMMKTNCRRKDYWDVCKKTSKRFIWGHSLKCSPVGYLRKCADDVESDEPGVEPHHRLLLRGRRSCLIYLPHAVEQQGRPLPPPQQLAVAFGSSSRTDDERNRQQYVLYEKTRDTSRKWVERRRTLRGTGLKRELLGTVDTMASSLIHSIQARCIGGIHLESRNDWKASETFGKNWPLCCIEYDLRHSSDNHRNYPLEWRVRQRRVWTISASSSRIKEYH